MAGISKGRVDYGDKGPVTKTEDQVKPGGGANPMASAPTRANIPVKGSDNENREEDSKASLATRPNSGK